MKRKTDFSGLCLAAVVLILVTFVPAHAQVADSPAPVAPAVATDAKAQQPVELNGDSVDYKADEGKFVASGNVVLKQSGATLLCDKLEFFRDKHEAHASGNVVVTSDKGVVWAENAVYNFATKKGDFTNARIMADPFFGKADSMAKVDENHYVMSNGYVTTSDYDDPEWRIRSKQIDVFPGDKATARNSVMYFGKAPVMYVPYYTQFLDDNRPHCSVIPGYSKYMGAYVLTACRSTVSPNIEMTYHVDPRSRRGLGLGIDAKYTPIGFGTGIVKTYYIDEHAILGKDVDTWQKNDGTPDKKRYRVEWRHKWDIDPATMFIAQYYKLTDTDLLKKYFEKEYKQDMAPASYFLFSHAMANSSFSVRGDFRVNRYNAGLERLPEMNYALNNQEIADTGLYFKSNNTASSLVYKDASPSDNAKRTMRFDTDNELSRPFKVSFLEMRPFVGTEQTYYSRSLDQEDYNSVRGLFKTGIDVSTKFYRVYDLSFKKYGIEVNRLLHVITPTITYLYQREPTLSSERLYPFDTIDQRDQGSKFVFGVENKLQTKRNDKVADLFRSLVTVDYRLRDNKILTTTGATMVESASSGSFGDVVVDNEFYPSEYVTFHSDLTYDNDTNHLRTANFDLYLKDNKKWEFDIGRRYTYHDDDLLTTQLAYTFNPKWRAVIYDQWNVDTGSVYDQQYSIVRDLHSWELELAFRERAEAIGGGGSEVWFIFRLKAFPSVGFNGGASYNKTKSGTN